jgi:hypothetical protein
MSELVDHWQKRLEESQLAVELAKENLHRLKFLGQLTLDLYPPSIEEMTHHESIAWKTEW